MGQHSSSQSSKCSSVIEPTAADVGKVPPFFAEMLTELAKLQGQLGGTKNFTGAPAITHKVKAKDLSRSYTDYEYIYLTILGFGHLHTHVEEIIRKNNGKVFTKNPGVQMLERLCGMTMHADREGANHLLRSAPASLLEAFAIAKTRRNGMREFFKDGFDRTADPCLEGRLGRLMEYLEARRAGDASSTTPPWEDVSLRPLKPGTPARDVVGEHLRVFMGESTWTWSRQRGISYEDAKTARSDAKLADEFATVFNAATFEAALISKGVTSSPAAAATKQWEAMADAGGNWAPYDENVNAQIEQGASCGRKVVEVRMGPKGWKYEIDLVKNVQRNPKTQKERPLRCVEKKGGAAPASGISLQDIRKEIAYFVDLCTIPEAPSSAASASETNAYSGV